MRTMPSQSLWAHDLYRRSRTFAKWLVSPALTLRRRAQWMSLGEKWAISSVKIEGQHVVFSGWAIAPPSLRQYVSFTCAGERVTHVEYPIDRPDVATAFPCAPDARFSGFICRHRLATPISPGTAVEFQCIDTTSGGPLTTTTYPYFWRRPVADDSPIPETARRVRVINEAADDYFREGGYLQYGRLQWALQRTWNRSFKDYRSILDWGCGCGRISRYFRHQPLGSFTGADVDSENVAWCRANLPFGKFETLPLHPPSTLAAGSFDLVFGISVFTHLRESDQNEWLTELCRITRPGANLLLTVHGDATLYRHPTILSPLQKQARKRRGILDISNWIYDAKLSEQDYYRETYHTARYIRGHWGRFLKIRNILPGFIGPQDLIIAERK